MLDPQPTNSLLQVVSSLEHLLALSHGLAAAQAPPAVPCVLAAACARVSALGSGKVLVDHIVS